MIGIKKGSEYLDLLPNTQIQRERSSPVFLEQTDEGKDGIPGEISYPFTLPLSDTNLRLLGFPDMLPKVKQRQHDVVLEDAGMQISGGKLVLDSVNANLSKNNVGNINSHLLSNISEFWQRVQAKKLSELQLGGERSFTWAGYSLVSDGFWKHVHDTWAYDNADDGDYVFDPIGCEDYRTEGEVTWINGWKEFSGAIELAREENYLSLCPQPFLVYVLRQVFEEHGYTLEGDILDDPDFKQICFESYKAVDWAVPTFDGPYSSPTITLAPRSTIYIRLNEHVPPVMTIGEFLVELQKLLPISFVINDRAKVCRVVLLSSLVNAGARDRTADFAPGYSLSFDTVGETRVYGFERNDDNENTYEVTEDEYDFQGSVDSLTDLPAADASTQNQMYYVRYLNAYFACINFAQISTSTFYLWLRVGHNVGSYLTGNQTDTISSNIAVSPISEQKIFTGGTLGDVWGYFIAAKRKGNWFAMGTGYNDADQQDLEFTPWPARIFFHRGKKAFSAGGTMPLATNGIYNFNSDYPLVASHDQVGEWSLSYTVGDGNYGLIETFWSKWLPVLELNEIIKGRLYLKFHEYLQWDWSQVLLIQNTPYLIKKITEILPYLGYIDIEAQRIS